MLKPPLTELQKTLRRMHLPLLVCQDNQWTFVELNSIDGEWVKIPREPLSVCADRLMAEAEQLMTGKSQKVSCMLLPAKSDNL